MVLACQNINKSFGTKEIIKNGSFHIEDREKAAVIGINGAGKTTLLKIMINEIKADSGEVIVAKGKTIGYLAQHQSLSSKNTIYEELLEVKKDIILIEEKIRTLEKEMKSLHGQELEDKLETYTRLTHEFEQNNGWAYQSEIIGVLKGLGFEEEEFSKSVDTLSGGQKTRVSLGKLLLSKPDIILLDEPTNHLDMGSITWLETFLINYQGAVIIVAHDRYFLDRVVSKIIEIDNGFLTAFLGNYTDYAAKKSMLREAHLKQYFNQQKEIKHQEDVIAKLRSFNREKSIKRAESREKLLNKIDLIEKPVTVNSEIHFKLEPHVISGNDVLTVTDLSKSFPPQVLFEHINFSIKRGEKIAIIGNNGTGKTTILKMINHMVTPDSGDIVLGSNVKIGYYDQEHQVLHMEKTLFDEMSDSYPDLTGTQIRNVLAAFLFTGDDVFKRIKDLSGGERGRMSLAKLMLSEANFLILDEPTNHLDIISKEILEQAISRYTGTVLYVSHDRYFINKTATGILDLTGNVLINYIGNYDYYLEKCEEMTKKFIPSDSSVSLKEDVENNTTKTDWKAKKEEQARERKRQNDIKKTEEAISSIENKIADIDHELTLEEVFTDVARLLELNKTREHLEKELEELLGDWETLLSQS